MTQHQDNNPLHGVKLKDLLTEIVDHYGFEILAEQININCFKSNPSINSSLKFLRKTQWARDKVEAFYLYKYKGRSKPSDGEFSLPPRDRAVELEQNTHSPADIKLGDNEFHDDPASGPRPFVKNDSRRSSKLSSTAMHSKSINSVTSPKVNSNNDPWGKWRAKNKPKQDQ